MPARRRSTPLKADISRQRIPKAAVYRLSVYGRILQELDEDGVRVVSSAGLADRSGFNPAQIRKDLAYFGGFGIRGVGYMVGELRQVLRNILGVTQKWKVALVGAGNLGSALLAYQGFPAHGFCLEAVFDKYPKGGAKHIQNLKVYGMDALRRIIRSRGIQMAVVAVPAKGAQEVLDQLAEAGVTAILNFAPTPLSVPSHVKLRNVDLSLELEGLSYYLSWEKRSRGQKGR